MVQITQNKNFGLHTLWFLVPTVGTILIGGPKAIWDWSPWVVSIVMIASLWGVTLLMALIQGTLNINNPGFVFGDLAYAGIGVSMLGTQQLPDNHWLNTNELMYAVVAFGYVMLILVEIRPALRNPDKVVLRASDWYHHGFYGPMMYWASFYPLIGTGIAFFTIEMTWVFPICLLCAAWWFFWQYVQIRWHTTERQFKNYGWRDIVRLS